MLVKAPGESRVLASGLLEGGRKITPETRFNVASLGKMFTAVAIGQLVDSGRLSFEDEIGKHLDELPPAFRPLTVRQLLSHTAGLGNYLEDGNFDDVERAATVSDLLPLLTRTAPVDVGQWRYSNTGYALAGAVIERVSGTDYWSYVRRNVFDRARMRRAGFVTRPGDALPGARNTDGGVHVSRIGTIRAGPAGGAFASAVDLERFAEALLQNRLTRPSTTLTLTTIQHERLPRPDDGRPRGWGLGFGVNGTGDSRVFGHVGGVPGAGAALRIQPSRGRIAIALANQDAVDAAPVASALLALGPGTEKCR